MVVASSGDHPAVGLEWTGSERYKSLFPEREEEHGREQRGVRVQHSRSSPGMGLSLGEGQVRAPGAPSPLEGPELRGGWAGSGRDGLAQDGHPSRPQGRRAGQQAAPLGSSVCKGSVFSWGVWVGVVGRVVQTQKTSWVVHWLKLLIHT